MKNIRKIIHSSEFYAILVALILANKNNINDSIISNSSTNNETEISSSKVIIDKENFTMPAMTGHTEYIEEYSNDNGFVIDEIDSQITTTEKLQVDITKEAMTINQMEENTNRVFSYDELKDSIYRISQDYGIPFNVMTTIGHQESGGQWNTNGVKSYTGDYGQYQINIRWNLESINNDLGFTEEDLLYNPYKSIEASAYLLSEIMNIYGYTIDNYDPKEIFGAYNGWIDWKDKEMAVEYAESCMAILEQNLYPYEEKGEKVKIR